MRSRVLDEVGIDQGNNISAQRLIPFRACRVEDLEPSLEIRVTNERVVMSEIATIGLDIAKNVFQLHAVDRSGKIVLRKALRRSQVQGFFSRLPPCLIGMEACGSAHFWARKLIGFGHTVKLMAPQFVKPYVKTNKNDARDAEAICEAVARPNMRFVPLKTT